MPRLQVCWQSFIVQLLMGGKQITTVQNELDNIKAYIQIQLISHENSFEVQYDLSDQGRKYNMPNFLLQPIVENAICHGADACEEENFEKETHCVKLAERTIEANKRFFDSAEDVPKEAYTMGIKTIMQAKKILVVVSGKDKASMVKRAFLDRLHRMFRHLFCRCTMM